MTYKEQFEDIIKSCDKSMFDNTLQTIGGAILVCAGIVAYFDAVTEKASLKTCRDIAQTYLDSGDDLLNKKLD